jgi:hypothetical protein
MKYFVPAAVAAAGLTALAAPAFAQSGAWYSPSGLYGDLGYTNLDTTNSPDTDLSAITGRVGARFGRYLGVEGEVSGGVGDDDSRIIAGDSVRTHLDNQYAGYLVGYLPVTPQFEFLARVGYGGQQYDIKDRTLGVSEGYHFDSVNYGVGAQYNFTPKDGVRVDYTRFDAQKDDAPDQNVWSVAYVRKF